MLLKGLIVEGDLAPRAGVEPATSPLGGVRSIQLSYRGCVISKPVQCMVEPRRIELPTSSLRTTRSPS